jgi:hypothetical protein
MHAIIANLLSATLLLQAVLGCCWQCAPWNADSKSPNVCQVQSCCQHTAPTRQQHKPPATPHKCAGCTASIYIPTQKASVDATDSKGYDSPLFEPLASIDTAGFCRGYGAFNLFGESPPPPDLQLLYQIFLI